jgi:hypothetical protein
VFHPAVATSFSGGTHETLLKASMPVNSTRQTLPSARRVAAKRRRTASAPVMMRAKQNRAAMQEPQKMQRWVVLTSWDQWARPSMVFTVSSERVFPSSYAAVPTEGGWLVVQL